MVHWIARNCRTAGKSLPIGSTILSDQLSGFVWRISKQANILPLQQNFCEDGRRCCLCGGDRFKLIREWNGHCGGYHTYLYAGHSLGRALEVAGFEVAGFEVAGFEVAGFEVAGFEAAGFEVLSSPNRNRPLDDLLALWGRQVGEPGVATSKAA